MFKRYRLIFNSQILHQRFNSASSVQKKIAVIGGSIAGSAVSIELLRFGMDVSIFEKAKKESMENRGAGIMLPRELFEKLQRRDMIEKSFQCYEVKERPIYFFDKSKNEVRQITSHSISGVLINWHTLYCSLVARIPAHIVSYEQKVVDFENSDNLHLLFDGSRQCTFDFGIFADGYNSLARNKMLALMPNYCQYVAWRGSIELSDKIIYEKLLNKISFYVYEKGHLLIYITPGINDQRSYTVNWVIYEATESQQLMHDIEKLGSHNQTFINKYKPFLMSLSANNFPHYIVDIISGTQSIHCQKIYDLITSTNHINNICLIGDASTLFRPHVGSGATKALEDAISMGDCLKETNNILSAVDIWNRKKSQASRPLFQLGKDLGSFFVTSPPEWKHAQKETIDATWKNLISGSNWYVANSEEKSKSPAPKI